jgi:hypothetical protein
MKNIKLIFVLLFLSGETLNALLKYGNLPYITESKKRVINNFVSKRQPTPVKVNAPLKRFRVIRKLDQEEGEEAATYDNGEEVENEEYGEQEGEHEEEHEGELEEEQEEEQEEEAGEEEAEEEHEEEGEHEEEEHEDNHEDEYPDEEGEAEEEPLPTEVEDEEVQAAIEMVEYKLTEINELMKECIENMFAEDILTEKDDVLTQCTGLNYQILFQNYRDAIVRVKQIFFEIIKIKSSDLDEEYEDEINYFLDILTICVDTDYGVKDCLNTASETSKYSVSPAFFKSLMEYNQIEIDALDQCFNDCKTSRNEVQDLINQKLLERQAYLDGLKEEVHEIEEHEPAPTEESESESESDSTEEEQEPEEASESESTEEEQPREEPQPTEEEESETESAQSASEEDVDDENEGKEEADQDEGEAGEEGHGGEEVHGGEGGDGEGED